MRRPAASPVWGVTPNRLPGPAQSLQLATRQGASPVIAIDINDMRLAVAETLGATRVVNSTREDPTEVVQTLTEGRGADAAIECAREKIWLAPPAG